MLGPLHSTESNEIKIEQIESFGETENDFENDVCIFDTSESHIESMSTETTVASRRKRAIANMEKVFDETNNMPQFSFVTNFTNLDDFLQNRESDEQVDIFLEW